MEELPEKDHMIIPNKLNPPTPETKGDSDFRRELEHLINRHSMENGSDTPDFLLAQFLTGALELFDTTVKEREKWYGREKTSDGTVL